jgi:hypothetical protein
MWVCTVHPMTQLGPNHIFESIMTERKTLKNTLSLWPYIWGVLGLNEVSANNV